MNREDVGPALLILFVLGVGGWLLHRSIDNDHGNDRCRTACELKDLHYLSRSDNQCSCYDKRVVIEID